jgi:hypothetical protein
MNKKQTHKVRKYHKLILRIVGITLMLIGIALSCFWYFWLSPAVKRSDPHWQAQLSLPEYWEYIQKNIYRCGWSHDDFSPVGLYGGKNWAKWIMTKAAKGEELCGCCVGSKDDALWHITNQDPANGKSTGIENKWREWWGKNKNKSQTQWLRDGFVKYGIKLSIPPKKEEYASLLKLLANEKKNEDKTSVIPDYIKYNAFRWLRDSGFKPADYVSNTEGKSISKDVVKGIFEYQELKALSPTIDGVGALNFKVIPAKTASSCNTDKYDRYMVNSYWSTRDNSWMYTIIYSVIVLPFATGIFLLFWSTRKKKEKK